MSANSRLTLHIRPWHRPCTRGARIQQLTRCGRWADGWEAQMLGRITGAVRFRESLSFHTSLRIGGPAEYFIMPQDLDDLRYALAFAEQEDLPLIVIGGGNNLLVSDRGLQAVVVKLEGILSRADFAG